MKELLKSIEPLIQEELDRANEKFPQFSSSHEGYAVLMEEVEEAEEDMKKVTAFLGMLKELVKGNEYPWQHQRLVYIKANAHELAAEAIQVAAMAQKFIDRLESEEK